MPKNEKALPLPPAGRAFHRWMMTIAFGVDETRTRHFQIANLTLYQMSYDPDNALDYISIG